MNIEISIKSFGVDQISPIKELFSEHVAPNDRLVSESYMEWLYITNPFGSAEIVTAVQDGRWLGFMALVPICFIRQGETKTGYFVVNVLVRPKQRGKNIFKMMIDKAIEYVDDERAILMGHPNSMAFGAWKRAEMHFQPPLRSYLVVPKLFWGSSGVHDVADGSELEQFIDKFNNQSRTSQEWQVRLSVNYLSWRYLRHPTNRYRLRAVTHENNSVGLIVVKEVYMCVNMLIDQFELRDYVDLILRRAPWFTVAFLPDSLGQGCRSVWATPARKELRFFFTDFQRPIGGRGVMRIGLSPSDF